VWAQIRFVDHTVLGENWTDFANEYCYRTGWMGYQWKFNPRKHKQFINKLKPHIYRLTAKQLGFKEAELHPVPVVMVGEQRRFYDQMKRDSVIRPRWRDYCRSAGGDKSDQA
jgi:hypothetical protein